VKQNNKIETPTLVDKESDLHLDNTVAQSQLKPTEKLSLGLRETIIMYLSKKETIIMYLILLLVFQWPFGNFA
jgi:hypothetical protein